MKIVLKQVLNIKGPCRHPKLAPVAYESLVAMESSLGAFIYNSMWKDAVSTLLDRRLNKSILHPGYNGHNFGLSVDIDVKATLRDKHWSYDQLLDKMESHYWFCYRRDRKPDSPGSEHFNFLGKYARGHLVSCTQDPTTWNRPTEEIIWEKYKSHFIMNPRRIQELLARLGLYVGPLTETIDSYTREAIMAFQRLWDLPQNGFLDPVFCRVLAFVTADIETI